MDKATADELQTLIEGAGLQLRHADANIRYAKRLNAQARELLERELANPQPQEGTGNERERETVGDEQGPTKTARPA